MKNLKFLQFYELHHINKGEGVQIKVSSVKELKEKIKAFELLFDTQARINFYTEPGIKTYTKDPDGWVFTYPIYHNVIEKIKSISIGSKFIKTDAGYTLIITEESEIWLLITK